jgi:hypothetical protein
MNDNDTPMKELNCEIINKSNKSVGKNKKNAQCNTLTWNTLGKKLFAGFTDGYIRVWHVATESSK